MDEPVSIGLEVIRVVVSHGGKDFLGIRQLGRLSMVSKSVAAILDDALYRLERGRRGLLTCFSDPSEAVLERVGYKQAAACLLGKCCTHCGKLTGDANPLTLQRISTDCYEEDEASHIISKSKAKDTLLLSDKNVKSLPVASFPDVCYFTPGKKITSTFLLAIDVKEAAFSKHGGPDGLEAAISKKKAVAKERFLKSQSTSKPQKKRSKIERLWGRPADLIKMNKFMCLPIGTFFDTTLMKMTKSIKCNKCSSTRSGCLADIIMHEKLEHGYFTNYHLVPPFVVGNGCAAFPGLELISGVPAATPAMVNLFSSATFEYGRLDYEDAWGGEVYIEERKVCVISFNNDNDGQDVVKVCVDFICMPDDCLTGLFSAYVDVCLKKGSDLVPKKVLSLDLENGYVYDLSREDDFNHDNFQALTMALGIPGQVEAAPLMAMFLSRVLGNLRAKEIYEAVVGDDDRIDHHIQLFHDVFKAMIRQVEQRE